MKQAAVVLMLGCMPTDINENGFVKLDQTCYPFPTADGGWAPHARDCQSRHVPDAGVPIMMAVDAGAPAILSAMPDMPVITPAPVMMRDCEAEIRAMFARELNRGGCQDSEFGGCHEAPPEGGLPFLSGDLRVELNRASECGVPYLTSSVDDSLLWLKLTSPTPPCGDPMPPRDFGVAPSAMVLECVRTWIAANAR